MSDHALFSPSGAHRWIACPGSLALEQGQPNPSSSFADEGTAAHSLASWCLDEKLDADAYIGRIIEAGSRNFTVDATMAEHVQVYVDRVREYADGGVLMVEQRVPFGSAIGQSDDLAFGTGDAVIVTPGSELQLHDLKYGMGVRVEADENPQLMLYALGALSEFEFLGPFTGVRLVIHQPRLNALSEWACSVDDLLAFADEATVAARTAKLHVDTKGLMLPLTAGDKQCKFCRAKAVCPALAGQVVEALVGPPTADGMADLDAATVEQAMEQVPRLYSDVLGQRMALVDQVEGWCKAIRARVEAELFAGRGVTGFKLVEGRRGARAWIDAAAAEAALKAMRLKAEVMYDFKLISPTTADKLAKAGTIGPRQWPKVLELIGQSDGKPSVAPASDKRPPIAVAPLGEGFADLTLPTAGALPAIEVEAYA